MRNHYEYFVCPSTSQGYAIRREIYGPSGHDGRSVYFTLAFAGIALMAAVFVGVAVAKYRASRHPHAQGFVEVDQVRFDLDPFYYIKQKRILDANMKKHVMIVMIFFQTAGAPITPEERHVANMQINGYENPTYKYFEVKE